MNTQHSNKWLFPLWIELQTLSHSFFERVLLLYHPYHFWKPHLLLTKSPFPFLPLPTGIYCTSWIKTSTSRRWTIHPGISSPQNHNLITNPIKTLCLLSLVDQVTKSSCIGQARRPAMYMAIVMVKHSTLHFRFCKNIFISIRNV